MRVGIKFDLRNPAPWQRNHADLYAQCLERCAHADARGVGSIWISEHHFFDDGYMPQPLTFAAAVAARTRQARVGTAIVLAPFRSPVLLAEEAAVVDLLSSGRLDLGLGAGHSRREFERFGADFAGRFKATDDAAIEIRRLWNEGGVTPQPAQPKVPIYLGYTSVPGAYRTGKNGFGLISVEPTLCEAYMRGLSDGGFSVNEARLAGDPIMMLTDDPERTFELVKHQLAWRYDTYNAYSAIGTGKPAPTQVDPEHWRPGRPPNDDRVRGFAPPMYNIVTPDEAIRRITELDELGFPIGDVHLYCISGIPDDVTERHIELVCDRLVPALADLGGVN